MVIEAGLPGGGTAGTQEGQETVTHWCAKDSEVDGWAVDTGEFSPLERVLLTHILHPVR